MDAVNVTVLHILYYFFLSFSQLSAVFGCNVLLNINRLDGTFKMFYA